MQSKIQKQFREFRDTVSKLSRIEKVVAGMIFLIALLIPLPGTGPASIIMITAYVEWRKRRD